MTVPARETASQRRVLIVDADIASGRTLHGRLYSEGFGVTDADRIEQALSLCDVMHFDVVLLNLHRPQDNEASICGVLRSIVPYAAVLVAGESDDPQRKIAAFEAGADDYLTRPFDTGELVARIRAILRRGSIQSNPRQEVITIGDISLDPVRHTAFKSGRPVHLSPKEFGVLHFLMQNAGRPVSHAALLTALWGPEFAEEVTYLRTLTHQLRIKLDDGPNPRYILTDRDIGYHFVEPDKAQPDTTEQPLAPSTTLI